MLLDKLDSLKMPLSYGTSDCRLVLNDRRFTQDIVALRNHPAVNGFIHRTSLTEEGHERWLDGQIVRRDALNFVILIRDVFAGTVSLYEIEAGRRCEYGRLVMPDTQIRAFALAVEFLCLSFAFEILGLQSVYCKVARENKTVTAFHLANGWSPDSRYDQDIPVSESEILPHVGFSMSLKVWPATFEKAQRLLRRLHGVRRAT